MLYSLDTESLVTQHAWVKSKMDCFEANARKQEET
jgi:hypothetical protein